jgi:glutathione S-transferase
MIGTEPISRAKVRVLERVGNDLIVRCHMWLWNLTDAFPAKEPTPSLEVAGKAYRYVLELFDILESAIGNHEFLAGDTPTIADFMNFSIFQTARERFDQPLGESIRVLTRGIEISALAPARIIRKRSRLYWPTLLVQ